MMMRGRDLQLFAKNMEIKQAVKIYNEFQFQRSVGKGVYGK